MAFIIFWLIFKVRKVWIPLAGIAICACFVRDYFPVNLPSPAPADSWKIVSFNAYNYGGKAACDEEGNNLVVNYLAQSNADIICLQEASSSTFLKQLKKLLEGQGYEIAQHKGLIICSRLHIISSDTLQFPTRSNGGFRAYLEDGNDTILLINNHFESNHLTPEVKREYKDAVKRYESDSLLQEITPMLRLLSQAAPMRGYQTDTVAAIIDAWLPRPVILCADFNDTPVSYVHRVLTRHLTSAYVQSGEGLGFTYKDWGFPVRIDNILFDKNHFHSFDTHIDRSILHSDHYPIITFLQKNGQKQTK